MWRAKSLRALLVGRDERLHLVAFLRRQLADLARIHDRPVRPVREQEQRVREDRQVEVEVGDAARLRDQRRDLPHRFASDLRDENVGLGLVEHALERPEVANAPLRQLRLGPMADGRVGEVDAADRGDVVGRLDAGYLGGDVEVMAGLGEQVGDAPRREALRAKVLRALPGEDRVNAVVPHRFELTRDATVEVGLDELQRREQVPHPRHSSSAALEPELLHEPLGRR